MIAEEIVKRMKKGELITNPKDKRLYSNKKLGIYEINKIREKMKKFTGFASDIPEDKIFTAEEIGKMTNEEFEESEDLIYEQLKNYGIPKNFEAEEKARRGELIWVNSYTRDDGTEVRGYYRRK